MPSAFVFGGSGQFGIAVASHLAELGWDVTAACHNGRRIPCDLASRGVIEVDASGVSRLAIVKGTNKLFDAIIDPTAYNDNDARELLDVQPRTGALVSISSASVYVDHQGRSLNDAGILGFPDFSTPIAESNPTVTPGEGSYAARKVAMEQVLLDARVPTAILRPCAAYGLYARHLREWWFIKRALDARPAIPLASNGENIFHTSSTTGVAELTAALLRDSRSGLFNVGDSDPPSVREIAAAIESALQLPVPVAGFAGDAVGVNAGSAGVGDSPWTAPRSFILDTRKAESLGCVGKTYRDQVSTVCTWAREQAKSQSDPFPLSVIYGMNMFDYDAEDRYLAARA